MPKPHAIACVLLATLGSARADDTGMLPDGAMLTWDRLLIRETADGDLQEPSDSEALRHRLNLAACECSRQSDVDTNLYYELRLSNVISTSRPYELWVGSDCTNDTTREINCRRVDTKADINELVTPDQDAFKVYDVINASPAQAGDPAGTMPCRQDEGQATVWVLVDTDGDSQPDFFSPRDAQLNLFTDVTGFDTKPPPQLENLSATGGEGSIEVSWDIPEGNQQDFDRFQAFCEKLDGTAPKTGIEPEYSTVTTVCGLPTTGLALTPVDLPAETGTSAVTLPAEFDTLDRTFLCGTETSATATSLRIEGLENGVEYKVAVVAIDFYGNPSGAFFTRTIVPKPVTDFWEDLHDRGSGVEGGFCSSSAPSGFATMLAVLGGVALLRRRRRAGAAAIVVGLALVPVRAHADDFTPYWEDPGTESEDPLRAETPKWQAGIKLGPWVPGIDDQVGKNANSGMGPYQAMFGNYFTVKGDGLEAHDAHVYQVLPMLDVDRFLWSGSGQLGIGGSLGYMQKSAYAYLDVYPNGPAAGMPTTPDDPRRPRSTAGRNTFRLIPLAVTATYRATQLDDLYGIPIVPYIRGGLSYYIWWLKGPTGDLAKICKDGSMTSGCDANKAYGGTLGFQGSIGIAVRAERVDRDAARSMVNSGIYHAGFYAELMAAVVDGFGNDKKLAVGDKTWFAGVNFEF